MKAVGLDGYRRGWVAVFIEDGKRSIIFFSSLSELESVGYDIAMIDIPIGLPAFGNRQCDIQASF